MDMDAFNEGRLVQCPRCHVFLPSLDDVIQHIEESHAYCFITELCQSQINCRTQSKLLDSQRDLGTFLVKAILTLSERIQNSKEVNKTDAIFCYTDAENNRINLCYDEQERDSLERPHSWSNGIPISNNQPLPSAHNYAQTQTLICFSPDRPNEDGDVTKASDTCYKKTIRPRKVKRVRRKTQTDLWIDPTVKRATDRHVQLNSLPASSPKKQHQTKQKQVRFSTQIKSIGGKQNPIQFSTNDKLGKQIDLQRCSIVKFLPIRDADGSLSFLPIETKESEPNGIEDFDSHIDSVDKAQNEVVLINKSADNLSIPLSISRAIVDSFPQIKHLLYKSNKFFSSSLDDEREIMTGLLRSSKNSSTIKSCVGIRCAEIIAETGTTVLTASDLFLPFYDFNKELFSWEKLYVITSTSSNDEAQLTRRLAGECMRSLCITAHSVTELSQVHIQVPSVSTISQSIRYVKAEKKQLLTYIFYAKVSDSHTEVFSVNRIAELKNVKSVAPVYVLHAYLRAQSQKQRTIKVHIGREIKAFIDASMAGLGTGEDFCQNAVTAKSGRLLQSKDQMISRIRSEHQEQTNQIKSKYGVCFHK